eukprot:15331927-Ditylum_brightwellii.AAC.1
MDRVRDIIGTESSGIVEDWGVDMGVVVHVTYGEASLMVSSVMHVNLSAVIGGCATLMEAELSL